MEPATYSSFPVAEQRTLARLGKAHPPLEAGADLIDPDSLALASASPDHAPALARTSPVPCDRARAAVSSSCWPSCDRSCWPGRWRSALHAPCSCPYPVGPRTCPASSPTGLDSSSPAIPPPPKDPTSSGSDTRRHPSPTGTQSPEEPTMCRRKRAVQNAADLSQKAGTTRPPSSPTRWVSVLLSVPRKASHRPAVTCVSRPRGTLPAGPWSPDASGSIVGGACSPRPGWR